MRALVLFALALGGCFYSPSVADDTLRCNNNRCPDGYYCAPDDRCWKSGHVYGVKPPDLGMSLTTPACSNGVKDPGETDVDCGGPCPGCATGKGCAVSGDCQSKICNMVSKTCAASDCQDGVRDDQETDVDCGGTVCTGCATGQACNVGTDCANHICNTAKMVCVASTCDDGVLDGTETDVDCGGSCATKCKEGKSCLSTSDCAAPGACDPTHHCVAAQCTNGVQDAANPSANPPVAAETDIDCGGTVCAPCPLNKKCVVGSDCQSGFCNASTKVCVADQCHDGIKDGSESDTDCGGSCATKCANGQMCGGPSDCGGSGATCDGAHVCCAPSCSGKVCGSDGCGGSCGSCTSGTNPACSSDGTACLCTSTSCPAGQACDGTGQCQCVPSCGGKVCGPDGCGGTCGNGCTADSPVCNASQTACSCSGSSCANALGSSYSCNASGQCVCTPSCSGKNCGSDGCGGSCGNCTSPGSCNASGVCVLVQGAACPQLGYPCSTGNCVDGVCCASAACATPSTPCSTCAGGGGYCSDVYNTTTAYCNGNSSCGASSKGGVWCGLNQGASCSSTSQCLDNCCSKGPIMANVCGDYNSQGCLP